MEHFWPHGQQPGKCSIEQMKKFGCMYINTWCMSGALITIIMGSKSRKKDGEEEREKEDVIIKVIPDSYSEFQTCSNSRSLDLTEDK